MTDTILASPKTGRCPPSLTLASAGDSAVLFTPASGAFDPDRQQRLLAMTRSLRRTDLAPALVDIVPGVNNVLVAFDPLRVTPDEVGAAILDAWRNDDEPLDDCRDIEIPVVYGGEAGVDLPQLADAAGIDIHEYVERHSSAHYTTACIGAYPGFAFLTGLPAALHAPRRATPRLKVAQGSVIVGGAQAGVMPCTAPSGWHILGHTDVRLFDWQRPEACLIRPGDRVRFIVAGVQP
ncbi:5-oxoprolinase subunit PxpB [Alcaligenaceae bacterium B3P038]|nr:5-oxoprolinase subunit PxpB [Alcaligenaceae bacterium B3P038]